MVKIKLDSKHKEYKKDKTKIEELLTNKNISYCQILGADNWRFSIFSATALDDMNLARSIGQMGSVTEISFEKD